MHELSIATELYRQVQSEIETRGGGQLESVIVAVGELSAVEPDLLEFAWTAVVEDGPDKAATLEVEWRRARQLCSDCGEIEERQEGSWMRLCPSCSLPLKLEGGRELDIISIAFLETESQPKADQSQEEVQT